MLSNRFHSHSYSTVYYVKFLLFHFSFSNILVVWFWYPSLPKLGAFESLRSSPNLSKLPIPVFHRTVSLKQFPSQPPVLSLYPHVLRFCRLNIQKMLIRQVRKVAKGVFYLRHICLSVLQIWYWGSLRKSV